MKMSQASETKGKAGEAAGPDGSPSGSKTPTPSQQNTTYATYPCPLWGKRFDDSVETRLDPATRTTYRHISRLSLQNSKIYMRVAALLIRDEYEKLYKLISEEAPPIKVGDEYSGVAVIGQPGIGKSLFLNYALLRRLSQKKPTAFQIHADDIWIFDDGEVRRYKGAVVIPDLPRGSWALCDSNSTFPRPSPFMLDQDFITIQTTYPQRDHYAQWIKEKEGMRYYMDVFSEQEIKQLSHLLKTPRAIDMYHRWGPSARNCIAFANAETLESNHANDVRSAAISLASNPPASSPGEALALIAGSHTLFCVRPMPGEKGYLTALSTVLSPHVQLIIQAAVDREDDEKRKEFYELLSAHPHCRSVISRLLEQQFHKWVGLDTDAPVPGAEKFLKCVSPSLPVLRLKPTREAPLDNVEDLAVIEDSHLPIYYRPTSERIPGVDGLILTANAVVLLQVTVSPAHALKKEHLVPLYSHLPPSIRGKPWKFVWVVPERDVGEALRKRKFDVNGDWGKIEFYWCLFRFDTKEGASEDLRLDIAEAGVKEDEHHIEMWGTDEGNGDEEPSTPTAPAPHHIQNNSNRPAKKARTAKTAPYGKFNVQSPN